jgi:exonuclease III
MKCLNWNLEWKKPKSRAGQWITEKFKEIDPDIACLTEVTEGMIPAGEVLEADPDYGYVQPGDRRKVTFWSKSPWTESDRVGDPKLPGGRYVSGVTQCIRFIGVCIPWQSAHVSTGRKDRKSWEDHLAYCQGLARIIAKYTMEDHPLLILGDFNQCIPRVRQPAFVAETLAACFPRDFTICTANQLDDETKPLIDHCASSPGLSARVTEIIPKVTAGGIKLSDHVGVVHSFDRI